jgi:peptidylprolyl isomerase domain and WD repeat-containing protein 1
LLHLDKLDFEKRLATERDLDKLWDIKNKDNFNVILPSIGFDETDTFLYYGSLLGIKIINLSSNGLVKLLGKVENTERFLQMSLY